MLERLERKFVVVTRRTRLKEMVARHSTLSQARFRARSVNADWADVEAEHANYERTLDALRTCLGQLARVVTIERSQLATHVFGENDILICLGQDGLVANTIKYTTGQYVMGLNPDPKRFDGILLGWEGGSLDRIVSDATRALDGKLSARAVTMAQATLSDGQTMRGVNDLFIGLRDHGSSRYRLEHGGNQERQSSSGILITTGLGATGWLKSVVTTAGAVTALLSGGTVDGGRTVKLGWDARELIYSVREAFPSRWTQTGMVFGRIKEATPLVIDSENPEGGVIFSDGMQRDALEFNAPLRAQIGIAPMQGRIAWPESARRANPQVRRYRDS